MDPKSGADQGRSWGSGPPPPLLFGDPKTSEGKTSCVWVRMRHVLLLVLSTLSEILYPPL